MGASASRGMERVIGEAPRPPASQGDWGGVEAGGGGGGGDPPWGARGRGGRGEPSLAGDTW
jgi:hypothetical protein